jgi:homeobox KN domain-containing protein
MKPAEPAEPHKIDLKPEQEPDDFILTIDESESEGREIDDDKKENRSFTKRQRVMLKQWFDDHKDTDQGPRPTPQQKTVLCRQTKLTLTQLNNWFSNQRRRHWKRRLAK